MCGNDKQPWLLYFIFYALRRIVRLRKLFLWILGHVREHSVILKWSYLKLSMLLDLKIGLRNSKFILTLKLIYQPK